MIGFKVAGAKKRRGAGAPDALSRGRRTRRSAELKTQSDRRAALLAGYQELNRRVWDGIGRSWYSRSVPRAQLQQSNFRNIKQNKFFKIWAPWHRSPAAKSNASSRGGGGEGPSEKVKFIPVIIRFLNKRFPPLMPKQRRGRAHWLEYAAWSTEHNCAVWMSVHVLVCDARGRISIVPLSSLCKHMTARFRCALIHARERKHRLFLALCIQYLQYLPLS